MQDQAASCQAACRPVASRHLEDQAATRHLEAQAASYQAASRPAASRHSEDQSASRQAAYHLVLRLLVQLVAQEHLAVLVQVPAGLQDCRPHQELDAQAQPPEVTLATFQAKDP